jgi:hypothetical protein
MAIGDQFKFYAAGQGLNCIIAPVISLGKTNPKDFPAREVSDLMRPYSRKGKELLCHRAGHF